MPLPILAYLRSVFRHWVTLVTGSVVAAIYVVLIAAFPDEPGKAHFWNHLPSWLVWCLVLLAIVYAQYLSWRELRAERDRLEEGIKNPPASFTSNGLAWSTLWESMKATGGGREGTLVSIIIEPHESGVEQLRQPLELVVLCSEEPFHAVAQFYDSGDFSAAVGKTRYYAPAHSEIRGASVYVELREPKLKPPAILIVFLIGRETLSVLSVTQI
jgi:hypothetical protein